MSSLVIYCLFNSDYYSQNKDSHKVVVGVYFLYIKIAYFYIVAINIISKIFTSDNSFRNETS